MTRQHTPGSAPDLTAKDWELILTALGAYQHQAACRALHEKVAPMAKAAGSPSLGAAFVGDGRSQFQVGFIG